MERLILLGCGGHASVVAEAAYSANVVIDGYVAEDGVVSKCEPLPHLGDDSWLLSKDPAALSLLNGIGGKNRVHIFDTFTEAGFRFVTVAHSSSVVARNTKIKDGVQIMAGAVIQPGVQVEAGAIINTRATIEHDVYIGCHAHIAPGAVIAGGVKVAERAFVGAGTVVIEGITIGHDAIVGAGAAVICDVPDGAQVVGVPAKWI